MNLVPSENYASERVLRILSSRLSNRYCEGYADQRYYAGTRIPNEIEQLTIRSAQNAFKTNYNANV